MDPLLLQAHRELAIGDAYDDALNSKTAFQLGDPSLSMPSYATPQLTYTPTAAPEQYGPPLSAMAAPSPVKQAAPVQRGKAGAVPMKAPPSFLMSPAFGGMNWMTVIGAGSAILLTTIGTILLARNASHSGSRRYARGR